MKEIYEIFLSKFLAKLQMNGDKQEVLHYISTSTYESKSKLFFRPLGLFVIVIIKRDTTLIGAVHV